MKKVLRNIFSGYFIILLILLFELGLFLFLQFYSDDFIDGIVGSDATPYELKVAIALVYLMLKGLLFIFEVIVFFKIINRDEDPEFKIPWIVLMIILPLFCMCVYLIFGSHGLKRKDKKIIKASNEEIRKYMNEDPFVKTEVGALNYIHSVTGLNAYKNNKVTYFKNGESFFDEMLDMLDKAKKFIFMEFFIIHDGILWTKTQEILKRKASEGVEIYIIYDDMGSSGTISSRTPKILGKYGIKCYKFHPFRPILSGVYNNRDHRKIVVVDGVVGYTGGMNLGDEYANLIKRFGYWKDTMVKIEGSAVKNLTCTFLQNYDLCTHKLSDYRKYLDVEEMVFDGDGYVMPFGDGPGAIDDALIGEQTYVNILNYAKDEVFISTPYLIPTYELLDAMRNASLRGVKVHLIIPGIPDKKMVYKIAQSNFKFLLDSGVKIYQYSPGFNHMKTILADRKLALVGTINFDFRSLVHHFECGTILYNTPCMETIKEDFLEMISLSKEVPVDFTMNKRVKRLCTIAKIFTPLL